MTVADDHASEPLGPNAWLVEEMYEKFTENPSSVSETWQGFFTDYRPTGAAHGAPPGSGSSAASTGVTQSSSASAPGGTTSSTASAQASAAPSATATTSPAPAPAQSSAPSPTSPAPKPASTNGTNGASATIGQPIRGAASRIVANMEASLEVPTATSYREVPAKLLEVNRKIVNGYLGRTRGGKISFTHLIGYALVRAVADHVPRMNNSYAEGPDGAPLLVQNEHIGLGIAIDMEKRDGSRSLLVPCIKNADQMNFAEFIAVYDELIRKAKTNKLTVDDFSGVTISLTNPGTIGTERSVPRLMQTQGLIVGVGSLAYPTSFAGADPVTIAELGISKVITLSSTYDHRIIQGAESGIMLKEMADLLLGKNDFYGEVFRSIGVPYEAVLWRQDTNSSLTDNGSSQVEKQMQVSTLINMHRVRGHLIADLDPLTAKQPEMHSELDPATYGLTIWDLDREFLTGGETGIYAQVGGRPRLALDNILHVLRDAYCRTVGIEFMHIQEPEEKRWIQEQVEGASTKLPVDDQRHILGRLNAAEALERFLATKYVGQKRFGLEGAESLIPILDTILESAVDDGLDSAVLGMSHRGRLNVLANIVGKSYAQLFREFEGHVDPDSIQGSGDVKYHLGAEGTFTARSGASMPVALAANPSHLEAVNPVVEGMARARMDAIPHDRDRRFPVLPILMHGDAAFAGQGVVAETLNLSLIKGYRIGGTIHVIVNNQLGFTTPPESARSSEYCTDIAKAVQAPIIHVNGDDPEACVRVARLAYAYRQKFHKDVVIDMVCYRRHGHNEGDDPSYTQPLMYQTIERLRNVRMQYVETLVRRGDFTMEEAEKALDDFHGRLQAALDETRQGAPAEEFVAAPHPPNQGVLPQIDTSATNEEIDTVYSVLSSIPEDFTVHPKLTKQLSNRDALIGDGHVDWALAESLAFGTLLYEGTSVRLAGQDSRRGTFSHRHSTLFDYHTGNEFTPLLGLENPPHTQLWIYDSLLSEYAALGFEYGYSVQNPDALVIWEAQFGDFANGAQTIIDQFIVAAEDKWGQTSGLVMLLPHGYEGQGPEHSSTRLERFLTLCAEDNIQVCQPTSAAQYFHLLRRQVLRTVRKPLIVTTPKSGLRDKRWRSPLDELTHGTFEELLGETSGAIDASTVTRLVLASGKIGHEAITIRDQLGENIAVARVEQLYPWPYEAISKEIQRYPSLREIVWLQEEPENMGAWNSVKGRLFEAHGDTFTIRRISRPDEASPATGSHAIHAQEQDIILAASMSPLQPRNSNPFR
ncbi:MAG: multifunctional oxoglutarate decarboxylase/oxoglutarate dehydrogenase thiamine pyrophosphate-binding subunit/dihydrolipoyllysine-residue succinyltransferase subunit [Microthrixaceae bacterium]